jgi:hypothetical protein
MVIATVINLPESIQSYIIAFLLNSRDYLNRSFIDISDFTIDVSTAPTHLIRHHPHNTRNASNSPHHICPRSFAHIVLETRPNCEVSRHPKLIPPIQATARFPIRTMLRRVCWSVER